MPESILLVEDDPDIARFVEVNLVSAGYVVRIAHGGEEGLRLADEVRPDLVVLDVMMPGLSGFEVADRLRRNPRTANARIVILTAKSASADRALAMASGADDFLVKPIDPGDLLARVRANLDRGALSAASVLDLEIRRRRHHARDVQDPADGPAGEDGQHDTRGEGSDRRDDGPEAFAPQERHASHVENGRARG
jgi:DNA-binding response OmpR family regulator